MNKYGELPPPYEEEMPVETTPLLHGRPHRTRRRTLGVAVAALFATYLVMGFVFLYPLNPVTKEKDPEVPVRIAVIGAGPAGVSAAFTLDKLTKAKRIKTNITIFEEKNGVGGRMLLRGNATHPLQGFPAIPPEDIASGNLLHNRILRERDAKSLTDGYGKKWESLRKGSNVGFFDGEKIISVATRPADKSDWSEWLGRVFKYGASVWRARKLPTGTIEDFQKLLNLEGTYDNVGQMLAASDNASPVTRSALERLKLNGLSQEYIREALGPQVKRHGGQGVDELSDLALSMMLEREDQGIQTSDIGGRLTTVLNGFVNQSKAQLKANTKVSGMRREMVEEGKESWILEYTETENWSEVVYDTFDQVIIATPWNTSSFSSETSADEKQIQYRSQWLTFFISTTTLNTKHFGEPATLPAQILPIPSSKLLPLFQGIQEITHLKDIARFDRSAGKYHMDHLYRILSHQRIDKSTVHQMSQGFDDNRIPGFYQENIENAYPLLYARSGSFPSFKATEGLWHTSVVEAIGSSVDLSWVAGENVARLVGKEIERDRK